MGLTSFGRRHSRTNLQRCSGASSPCDTRTGARAAPLAWSMKAMVARNAGTRSRRLSLQAKVAAVRAAAIQPGVQVVGIGIIRT